MNLEQPKSRLGKVSQGHGTPASFDEKERLQCG